MIFSTGAYILQNEYGFVPSLGVWG